MIVRHIPCDGGKVPYVTFGSGSSPLVILPGMSVQSVMLSADAVAAAYADFTADRTVYVFERRDPVPAGFTVADMAGDTAAAMDRLGLREADVSAIFL